ncbi:hypothetical protein HYH02_009334 [Chlamydomonas schloesseri]|uniref:Condensin complex subunit 2 n=1 Tax=Chlamydomonas schloesseri TaxID=2026947 RepID=A0A835W9Z5_9CHLO|nr:hypothetical protein HYH02_009334 [Chlamydomonas schloesseri]|eukprot:KAG2443261.1 hypothetical protein HYH02_009334 [Chlamydomonas schloesseri]
MAAMEVDIDVSRDQERRRRAIEKLNKGINMGGYAQPDARPELTVLQATKIITEASDALQGNKKINAQNAFDIQTADALVTLVFKDKERDEGYFVRNGQGLDTAMRVWGYRIDNVYNQAYQVLGPKKGPKADEDEDDAEGTDQHGPSKPDGEEGEEGGEGAEGGEEGAEGKRGKGKKGSSSSDPTSTLVSNNDLRTRVKEPTFDADPFFINTSRMIDEISPQGLLLHNLPALKNFNIVFDASAKPSELLEFKAEEGAGTATTVDLSGLAPALAGLAAAAQRPLHPGMERMYALLQPQTAMPGVAAAAAVDPTALLARARGENARSNVRSHRRAAAAAVLQQVEDAMDVDMDVDMDAPGGHDGGDGYDDEGGCGGGGDDDDDDAMMDAAEEMEGAEQGGGVVHGSAGAGQAGLRSQHSQQRASQSQRSAAWGDAAGEDGADDGGNAGGGASGGLYDNDGYESPGYGGGADGAGGDGDDFMSALETQNEQGAGSDDESVLLSLLSGRGAASLGGAGATSSAGGAAASSQRSSWWKSSAARKPAAAANAAGRRPRVKKDKPEVVSIDFSVWADASVEVEVPQVPHRDISYKTKRKERPLLPRAAPAPPQLLMQFSSTAVNPDQLACSGAGSGSAAAVATCADAWAAVLLAAKQHEKERERQRRAEQQLRQHQAGGGAAGGPAASFAGGDGAGFDAAEYGSGGDGDGRYDDYDNGGGGGYGGDDDDDQDDGGSDGGAGFGFGPLGGGAGGATHPTWEQLLEPPRRVQRLAVKFDKTAGVADVASLKRNLEQSLKHLAITGPKQPARAATAAAAASPAAGGGVLTFQEVLDQVGAQAATSAAASHAPAGGVTPGKQQRGGGGGLGSLAGVSTHLAFICLLHLANEKSLALGNGGDMDTLHITSLGELGAGRA